MSVEVVTIGEAMLRLSVPAGTRLEDARQLDVHVAGAELNTAVALAALGRDVAWISRLPESPLGRRVARQLGSHGVDISQVRWVPDARMGVYFVELAAPPRPVSVVYDRAGSAAAGMTPEDMPSDLLDACRVAHVSGITPALSPGNREAALAFAERARSGPCLLTVDINYRAKLWSPDEASRTLRQLGAGADVVVVTREDARDVFGWSGDDQRVLSETRRAFEARRAVLTLGAEGALWESDDGSGRVPALATAVIDRLGAGDAFMAGVIEGLLIEDFERGLEIGAVLASLALGTAGDQVVTTSEEVRRILEGDPRSVDR